MGTFVKLSLVNDTMNEDASVYYDGGTTYVPPSGAVTGVMPYSFDYNEHATSNVFAVNVVVHVLENATANILAISAPTVLRFVGNYYIHHIDIDVHVVQYGNEPPVWEAAATLYRTATNHPENPTIIPLTILHPQPHPHPHLSPKSKPALKMTVRRTEKAPRSSSRLVKDVLERRAKRQSSSRK